MDNYQTVKFKNHEYYLATDIYDFDSAYFHGTNKNVRNIVEKRKISVEDYIYAYIKDKKWIVSNKRYCRSKLLLKKEWCIDNIPKFAKHSTAVSEVEKLPPLLQLDDDEKFSDGEYMYNIKIRGNRKMDECYFSVLDVGSIFKLARLKEYVVDKRRGYEVNTHYKYFTYDKNDGVVNNKKSRKVKTLYFTYEGLIRCLYVSHSPKAKEFRTWACNILFVHQFGNKEEREALSSKLLGVHAKAVREVFRTSATTIPCIYLFALGTASELRDSMNLSNDIDDDDVICKYGMTDSLERRTYEHNRTFSKIKNTELHLKYYAYVDPQYISEAENDISDYFSAINAKIKYEEMTELVALSPKKMNNLVKKQYTNMSNLYGGHIKDLITKIKILEDELKIQEQKHKNDILEKDNRILKLEKDMEINKMVYENKLMKQELEYMKKKKR
jgi:hypothetical protein